MSKIVKEQTCDEDGNKRFEFEVENDYVSCYFLKDGKVVCSLEMDDMINFLKDSLSIAKEYKRKKDALDKENAQ